MPPAAKSGVFIAFPLMLFLLGLDAEYGQAFYKGHSKVWVAMLFYLGWLSCMAAFWLGTKFFTWLERKYPWTKL